MPNTLHGLWSAPIDYNNPSDNKKVLEHINSPNFTEDEYIKLLTGEYNPPEESYTHSNSNKKHAEHLLASTREEAISDAELEQQRHDRMGWPTPVEKQDQLKEQSFAHGALRDHPFNNPETNSKVLAELENRIARRRALEELPSSAQRDDALRDLQHGYDIRSTIDHILKGGKISKQDLIRAFSNPSSSKAVLQNKDIDQGTYDQLMGSLSPGEVTKNHIQTPFFNERHARKILNSNDSINPDVAVTMAEKGMLQPKHAERFMEQFGSSALSQRTKGTGILADTFMDSLPEARRKSILDRKLGIEGGQHSEKRPDSSKPWDTMSLQEKQDNWDDNVNWQNWEHGPEHDPEGSWASSRHLTEDQIEHIKRHGTHEEKMALFENPSVDPKHGAEMWQKWDDNDKHHGYDMDQWKEDYKRSVIDGGNVMEIYGDEARQRAEEEYPIDDYIRDHYENGRVYDDKDLEQHILNNPDEFNTVHENPDFDSRSEEHPENNPRHIDFADGNSGGGHSYGLSDHPHYDEMLDEAESQMRQEKGIPDFAYEGYSDTISNNEWEYAQQAFEDTLDDFHKDWDNLPAHLKGKIPGVVEARMKERLADTKSALKSHDLDGPYSQAQDKYGWYKFDESLMPTSHEYAPGLHHHQMIKDYADANDGKIDLGTLIKRHPNLKDKFKQILGDKQSVTSDEMQSKIDQMPKTKYGISMRTWGKNNMQNINGNDQLVVRLDHSPDSYKQFESDPDLLETFRKIQDASQRSGHPTNEDSIAWSRIDTSNPKHWMIDEVQSDFGSALRRQIESAEHGDPNVKAKLIEHLDKIEDAHKDWRENIMNFVINLAKKHGVEQVSTHSPESKAAHTGAQNIHTVYKDSYHKVPRQLGFRPVEAGELPLSEQGKKIFGRNIQDKPRFTAEELEGRTPDEHQQKLHHDAMEHHLRQARIHSSLAKIPTQGSLFEQDGSEDLPAPEGFSPGTAEHHAFMFEQHKKKFSEHKRKAMQHDPTNFYAKNVKFDEYGGKSDLSQEDFDAAQNAITLNAPAAHHGDKLLESSEASKMHPGHTLDLRPAALKKSEADLEIIGEIFAVKLMEIL